MYKDGTSPTSNSNNHMKTISPGKASPYKFRVKRLITNHEDESHEISGQKSQHEGSLSRSKIILQ